MQRPPIQQQRFLLGLISLCLFYLIYEFFFNTYAMISVDEFWFAHRVYQYKEGLPYRDFAPYKTVLGYYFLLIPLLLTHGIMQTLIFVKHAIAIFNAVLFFIAALWLTRFFSKAAVLTSLALLISTDLVLSYSTQIRVDLFGYWFCFFALLFLLDKRFLMAGCLLGLGFITTQKAVWYFLASNCALLFWMVNKRDIKTMGSILHFNSIAICVILLYLFFWSQIADWQTVVASVFAEAKAMYHLDWYNPSRLLFWTVILFYNPLLFLLSPLTWLSLAVTYEGDKSYQRRFFIILYAFVILACLIPYKQVFPYYMQVSIPIFFILYTAFFTWLFGLFQPHRTLQFLINKYVLWAAFICYLIAIITLFVIFQLPDIYLMLCLIPLLLIAYITYHEHLKSSFASLFFNLIVITLIFTGSLYPLTALVAKVISLNGAYQKANIKMINALLVDGSDYVAGIELIYNKDQPIAGLRHLMGPAIDYLYQPTENNRAVMLASLYEDPNATTSSVIAALKKSSVKFYVNNYRMNALPSVIKNYLSTQYEHWWGSIYLYAPQVAQGKQRIMLKFSGTYLIESATQAHIQLNGKSYHTHAVLYLPKGHYQSFATTPYRLKLLSEQLTPLLDRRFQQDDWWKIIF